MANDLVFVQGLELYCVIGLQPWERQVKQKVRLDLELETDCRPAGLADDPALALDYKKVAKRVQALVEASEYQLVEALAEHIASDLLATFSAATAVRVRLAKPGAVRWSEAVGVAIERRRE